jgi:hypothetical protein
MKKLVVLWLVLTMAAVALAGDYKSAGEAVDLVLPGLPVQALSFSNGGLFYDIAAQVPDAAMIWSKGGLEFDIYGVGGTVDETYITVRAGERATLPLRTVVAGAGYSSSAWVIWGTAGDTICAIPLKE